MKAASLNGRQPEVTEVIETRQASVAQPQSAPVQAQPAIETPKAPKNRKGLKIALAGLGVGGAIAASAFGYNYWQFASTHQSTDNATVTGNIHPVGSRISGTVDQVYVEDNQEVKSGQPLIQLDQRDYQLKLSQAQADLEAAQRKAASAQVNIALSAKNAEAANSQAQGGIGQAQAAIASAQAQVSEAQAGVPAAQAALDQANATLQKTQADFNRYRSLFNSGAVSQRDLDSARQAYEVARAQRDAASQGVRQAQAKVAQAQQAVANAESGLNTSQGGIEQAQAKGVQTEVSRADYQTAQAAINQAQAALKNAAQQLAYTSIAAPVSGRIGRKNVQVGQQVQPGTPLVAIVDDQYWVTANFKETQLENMRPGEKAEIKLDSFPHHTFTGRVESISPASGAQFALLPPDNATGNFTKVVQRIPVRVVFDRESVRGFEQAITPGMSAEVTIETGK
ncbi:HlyD family secretion protein [Leptolyngbya sp. NIES-2104]|uniref:HlyD family secretion protein n=1 Tax=Leptolyngbya sp. NIES-2104 TaxID=1552121 RepID=UPI0006ECA40F|nr:HlyD family secretion protein [Leptolyngbya sp. NIES-2104]GAP93657.1 membrane fusion component of tripartite multidrug resistance system [Leptolyngbya sp. NIES-2104]